MAEKFGIGPGPQELKIGNSFLKDKGQFHTIKYDFKPASLDPRASGSVELGDSNSLSVKVPHSNGSTETQYSGFLKDTSHKECVLIIDRVTGEITLEKLSGQMLLKKTRQERRCDKSETMPDSRLPMSTSSSSSSCASSAPSAPPQPSASSSSSSRPQTPVSSFKRDSPAGTPKPLSRSASPHVSNSSQMSQAAATVSKIDLSESSSSGSSSSGSDTDSDFDDVPDTKPVQQKAPSMPSFMDAVSSPIPPVQKETKPPAKSMPQFLNDDLQLSESDEDSN